MRHYTCVIEVDGEKCTIRFPTFKPSVVISVAETKAREWYKQKFNREAINVHVRIIAPSFQSDEGT